MLTNVTPPTAPAVLLDCEPGICDHCDTPGLVTLTRTHGAVCVDCYGDGLPDMARTCDRCYARQDADDDQPVHADGLCADCRIECHDHDDQGD